MSTPKYSENDEKKEGINSHKKTLSSLIKKLTRKAFDRNLKSPTCALLLSSPRKSLKKASTATENRDENETTERHKFRYGGAEKTPPSIIEIRNNGETSLEDEKVTDSTQSLTQNISELDYDENDDRSNLLKDIVEWLESFQKDHVRTMKRFENELTQKNNKLKKLELTVAQMSNEKKKLQEEKDRLMNVITCLKQEHKKQLKDLNDTLKQTIESERVSFDREMEILDKEFKLTSGGDSRTRAKTPLKYVEKLERENKLLRLGVKNLKWNIRSAQTLSEALECTSDATIQQHAVRSESFDALTLEDSKGVLIKQLQNQMNKVSKDLHMSQIEHSVMKRSLEDVWVSKSNIVDQLHEVKNVCRDMDSYLRGQDSNCFYQNENNEKGNSNEFLSLLNLESDSTSPDIQEDLRD